MAGTIYTNSTYWQNKVRRERRRLEKHPELAVCWLCGEPIDMELPPLHADAFTLDHLVPLARGGDIRGDVKPAHRRCNSSRGDGRKRRTGANPLTLGQW